MIKLKYTKYERIKIFFDNNEEFEECDVRVEISDNGVIHILDPLGDEWIFAMSSVKKYF